MSEDSPNVLLVILDSLRARNASLYGYHRDTTPFLETFAEGATTYTQARAAAARSLPSHASIFTGYLPQEHGLHTLSKKIKGDASVFVDLNEVGYETGLFSDNPYITDLDTGLSAGFDQVYNNRDLFDEGLSPSAFVEQEGLNYREFVRRILRSEAPVKSLLNGLSWMLRWRSSGLLFERSVFTRGARYADQFAEWRAARDGPWAACLNLMDTHVPFRPAREYDLWQTDESRSVRRSADMDNVDETETWKHDLELNAYDGTIRQADAVVEQLVESLRSSGDLEQTLVIVTSDHGEGFGERSVYSGRQDLGHGGSVEEGVLHVPLVVKRPGQTHGKTVTDPVSLGSTPNEIRTNVGVPSDGDGYGTGEVIAGARIGDDDVTALYRRDNDTVVKYVVSASQEYTELVPTTSTSYRTDDTVPDDAKRRIESLSSAPVTVSSGGDINSETRQRLAALGYTE